MLLRTLNLFTSKVLKLILQKFLRFNNSQKWTNTNKAIIPKIICIDIDGTIIHFTEWVDSDHFGTVLKDAPEATHILHKEGWYVIIYTTRADKRATGKFLNDNGFYFDSINENPYQPENAKGGKPIADIYVDDRAICFNGNWEETLKEVRKFKPWEERMGEDNRSKQVAKELLVTDFQQALYLHRHYDEMNLKLTNFAFGQVIVCFGACWTLLYAMQTNSGNSFLQKWIPWGIFGILLLSAAFSLLSILLICKNRSYFVRICRYINELRDYAITNNDFGFANQSKMWHNPKFPNVRDWKSTQLTSFFLIWCCYIIESAGTSIAFFHAVNCNCKLLVSLIIGVGLAIIGIYFSNRSLKEVNK